MDAVPLDDRGLLLGDGLFETILARDGAPVLLDPHLARLAEGCGVLGLPPPDADESRRLIAAALTGAGLRQGRAAVRLTLTAGSGGRGLERPEPPRPRLFATAAPAPAAGLLGLVTVEVRRNPASLTSRLKTLAYLDNVLARRAARAAGADEAVMLNTRGELACASAANLFWLENEALFTPALDCGVLAGVMRGVLIAAARAAGVVVEEARAGPRALLSADAVFLTNSLIGVRAAQSLDGRALSPPAILETLEGWVRDVA